MYSGGLPILYPFASIFFFVLYWIYKTLLLKYYEKTTRFNEVMPLFVTHWIKIGVLLHCLVTLGMITNSNLLPRQEIWESIHEQQILNYGSISDKFFARFLSKGYTIFYSIFLLSVFVWFIFEATLMEYVWALFAYCY